MISGSVSVTEENATTVVAVSGDLDLLGAPSLRSKLRNAVATAASLDVVVDLEDVGGLDDIGVGVLLGLRRIATADGRGFSVRCEGAARTVIDGLGVGALLSGA